MSWKQPWKQYTRYGVCLSWLCLFVLTTSLSLPPAAGQTLSTETGEFFDYFKDHFSSMRATIEEIDSAPEESPWPFTKDKASYEAELNEYLDDAISLLLPKHLINFRTEFTRIDSELELLREAKSDFEAERALGRTPQADASRFKTKLKSVLSVLGSDVSGLVFGVDVGDVDVKIRELEAQRQELIHTLRESLENEFGMSLEMKHCESLLYQANGDDLLGAIAAARSLTEIEGHIRSVLVKSNKDVSTRVRLRYYGLGLIVRLTIERLTEKHLRNYDEKYLPALAELVDDNNRIRRENRRLLDELKANHVIVSSLNIIYGLSTERGSQLTNTVSP